jgi:hypothetical protein
MREVRIEPRFGGAFFCPHFPFNFFVGGQPSAFSRRDAPEV